MGNIYSERIEALRKKMESEGLAAVIIPQADAHLSEYLAPYWQVRRWFTGFTGSAGDLVVTKDGAFLWTDSRYFLQAGRQLADTGVELMKDGLVSTPSIEQYLANHLSKGQRLGLDGMLFSAGRLQGLKDVLEPKGISIDCHYDPVGGMWKDRPALPDGKIYVHDEKYSGESARNKISKILAFSAEKGAGACFISALDDIAWTLNIRCDDVKHTPVATSFLFLCEGDNILYVDDSKLTDDLRSYLQSQGVVTRPYKDVQAALGSLPEGLKVLVEPSHTSGGIMDILGNRAVPVSFGPAALFKSCKNDIQISGIRKAMERDGVALVKSFYELEQRIASGTETTEMDVAEILHRHRSAGEHYKDESFGTIAGYGPHGAIVHYEADSESNSHLKAEGLLLVDSGAQYLDGTTDITRTICLGKATAEEKRDFTLVMKGHIALATMMFPDDTRGAQLDAIARQYLWRNGLSYLHGTGHGVGHFLGVHEGPQSIRLNYVDTPLQAGMITSNEPGLYRENVHGIRCENLVLCQKALENEFGTFLKFETLTLCPFDLQLFDTEIMSDEEISWLNNYHAMVADRIMPLLDDDNLKTWLKEHTQPLTR